MNKSNTSKGFANVSVKICKYVIMVIVIVVCATWAFNFGTKIFNSEGVEAAPGTDMTLTIEEGTTIDELANTLEEYGVIDDTTIFKVQSYIYNTKSIVPGTYIFNTSKSGEDLFEVIKEGPQENKKENETQEE